MANVTFTADQMRAIPQSVPRGPRMLQRPGWPCGAEYDGRGHLAGYVNLLTDTPLPFCGPEEPTYFLLHRLADKKELCGYAYFVGSETGPIKIGTSFDPVARMKNMQSGSPVKLSLMATAEGGPERERAYHEQFADHRLHGEWFSPHPDILAEIERLSPHPTTTAGGE